MTDRKIEIVPIEKVSGHASDAICEQRQCGKFATKDVILVLNGEGEYGYASCDEHSELFVAKIAKTSRTESQ